LKIQPEHDIKPGAVRSGLCRKPIYPFYTIFFGIMWQVFKKVMATCSVNLNLGILLQVFHHSFLNSLKPRFITAFRKDN
jgi:hypothetical protein